MPASFVFLLLIDHESCDLILEHLGLSGEFFAGSCCLFGCCGVHLDNLRDLLYAGSYLLYRLVLLCACSGDLCDKFRCF